MSWSDAKTEAARLMKEMRGKYPLPFVRMVVDALKRELRAAESEEKRQAKESDDQE